MTTATSRAADAEARTRTIAVWQEQIRIRVLSKGSGPVLVYFHGPWGLTWDPFLDELARDFTVHAPEHPGTTPDAPDDAYKLDGLWDLILCYDELLSALALERVAIVGHSFGGMIACELAAAYPQRVRALALIDPIGLWRESAPIVNWMMLNPADLPAHIFTEPTGGAAERMLGATGDQDAAARLRLMWAMGATGKFIWPLPDKGLHKRIHRVKAPTLLVWGADDRLVPPSYAAEFARRIAGARVRTVEHAGHAPHLERPGPVARMLREFLPDTT